MNWIETKISFDHSNIALATDLISNIFYNFGLQGVVVEEPEQGGGLYAIVGYIPADGSAEKRRRTLESKLMQLKREHGIQSSVTCSNTAEEDWAESWKAFFKPEKITRRLVAKPTWHPYQARPGEIVLEIDPGMAFGTGTHPTTILCLQAIETHLKPGDAVLDVGTGTGILLVAAAKLGAGRIVGIDVDPTAVEIARKNLHANGISTDATDIRTGHLLSGVNDRYQWVVANILTEPILTLLDDVKTVLADGGKFVLSGIIKENTPRVLHKIDAMGLTHLETRKKDEWVAVIGM